MRTLLFFAGAAALAVTAAPAIAQDHTGLHGHDMDDMKQDGPADAEKPVDHSKMDHSKMQHDMSSMGDTARANATGSGTALLPGNEGGHHGLHLATGDWMVMLHGFANGVYTKQTGPRGDDKAYVQSMLMLSAEHDTDWGKVQFRTMNSLEPLMSNRGYPSLFATGETAGGAPLVDRQHPHDFFMELSARVDVNIGDAASLFVYGGPVGEPALGPSVFMHRSSAKLNPEAPITHHWFDSTHITYGVVTAGVTTDTFQLEASAFRGREPDEERWGIEKPKLDSWSVRATYNPSPAWAMQVSTGRLKSPEVSHPDEDEQRTTASVHYANTGGFSAMAAYSKKNIIGGDDSTALVAEMNWDITDHHTVFGRFENVLNRELFPDEADPRHEDSFRVSKFQAGYAYRLPLTGPLNLALGGTVSAFAKPSALNSVYGNRPMGYTLFTRLSIGH
ncbi:hypothetical protein ACFOWX_03010 [Sphingorhabdus arenilitoris]|uniref:TonB-dependent receptor n=1 Tax=Sphingorhabdus arenilitoris TaxID=1490041 RepID=A0ABV8RFB7_9SPHN